MTINHAHRFTPGADLDARLTEVVGQSVAHSWRAADDEQEGAFRLISAETGEEIEPSEEVLEVLHGYQPPVTPQAQARDKISNASNLEDLRAAFLEYVDNTGEPPRT